MGNPSPHRAAARDLGDGRYGVWAAFEHRERCKALPGARWDPTLKCWWVPIELRAEADHLVARLNGDGTSSLAATVADLFAAVPERLQVGTYKALARAWHPDAGGDGPAMQVLADTWREVGR